jgi:hypothetical protein
VHRAAPKRETLVPGGRWKNLQTRIWVELNLSEKRRFEFLTAAIARIDSLSYNNPLTSDLPIGQ